ncbi:MAG: hypothetical protein KJ709_03655 [Nanoarchaeota archaeon]|nr:hypothetical protein [Nanoarchaeota archaeon]
MRYDDFMEHVVRLFTPDRYRISRDRPIFTDEVNKPQLEIPLEFSLSGCQGLKDILRKGLHVGLMTVQTSNRSATYSPTAAPTDDRFLAQVFDTAGQEPEPGRGYTLVARMDSLTGGVLNIQYCWGIERFRPDNPEG